MGREAWAMGKQMPGKSGIRGTSLIYLENQLIAKDTCILEFTAALFTIPKTRKQPKCPSTDEWIKKTWYIYICMYIYVCVCIYTYIHTHTHQTITQPWKKWNKAICSHMDGPRCYHIKWIKSKKDKYHMISLICVILNRPTDIEKKHMITKGEVGGSDKLGVLN